jgi:hypothetical protein
MSDHATPTGGDPIGRRGFLARGFWLVAGSIAGALALIGLAPTVAPAFRRNDERWISAGSAGLFMEGQPAPVSLARVERDAFLPRVTGLPGHHAVRAIRQDKALKR